LSCALLPCLQSYAVDSILSGADLTNAVVDRVDFTNAKLNGAKFVNAVVTGACGTARWPAHLLVIDARTMLASTR
jgi:uncharacterized protein YjbI with pentapeptide repeats